MTKKEKEILEIIRQDPTIEQNKIAQLLGISRSTVAVHISSLQKQGYLLGKGYIVAEEDYIVGIGASNVDVYGKSRIPLREHYDHPADIVSSVGGVMHNIITNYAMLSGKARMITAFGDDAYGKMILEDYKRNGIDISASLKATGRSSGVFIQVQDENNDMHMALCDMSILEEITPSYIRLHESLLRNAKIVVIDPSLKEESIAQVIDICKGVTPIYIDPISDNFAKKIAPFVKDFDFIKPNRFELSQLADMEIRNKEDMEEACQKLLDSGLKKIVLSLSKDGILYMDSDHKIYRKFKEEEHMVNASGAGDALMAAILYGEVNGMDLDDTLDLGLAAGIAAVRSVKTINDDMSLKLLKRIIKENRSK